MFNLGERVESFDVEDTYLVLKKDILEEKVTRMVSKTGTE